MYAVIAIVISILVVSEWFRDLVFEPMVLFFAPILNQMLLKAFKFVVCATVLFGTLKVLHALIVVTIAKQEGIDAIIKAMGRHPNNAYVQYYGCSALRKFSANDYCCWALQKLFATDANKVEIVNQGGTDGIIKALGTHPNNTWWFQKWVCWALRKLSAYDYCCWALRKLAGNNANKVEIATQLSVEIAKQGGIDAIIAKHGSSDAIRVEITKQGGIDAIIKALDTLPDHAWVQKVGRWALGFLANNAEIKQEIINKGGEKYLK